MQEETTIKEAILEPAWTLSAILYNEPLETKRIIGQWEENEIDMRDFYVEEFHNMTLEEAEEHLELIKQSNDGFDVDWT